MCNQTVPTSFTIDENIRWQIEHYSYPTPVFWTATPLEFLETETKAAGRNSLLEHHSDKKALTVGARRTAGRKRPTGRIRDGSYPAIAKRRRLHTVGLAYAGLDRASENIVTSIKNSKNSSVKRKVPPSPLQRKGSECPTIKDRTDFFS